MSRVSRYTVVTLLSRGWEGVEEDEREREKEREREREVDRGSDVSY